MSTIKQKIIVGNKIYIVTEENDIYFIKNDIIKKIDLPSGEKNVYGPENSDNKILVHHENYKSYEIIEDTIKEYGYNFDYSASTSVDYSKLRDTFYIYENTYYSELYSVKNGIRTNFITDYSDIELYISKYNGKVYIIAEKNYDSNYKYYEDENGILKELGTCSKGSSIWLNQYNGESLLNLKNQIYKINGATKEHIYTNPNGTNISIRTIDSKGTTIMYHEGKIMKLKY